MNMQVMNRKVGPSTREDGGDEGTGSEDNETNIAYTNCQTTITKDTRFPWTGGSLSRYRGSCGTGFNDENSGNPPPPNVEIPRLASYKKFLDPQADVYGLQVLTVDTGPQGRQCPINPNSKFVTLWKVIMLAVLLVSVMEVPIVVAWQMLDVPAKVVGAIVDVFFMIDFVMQFFEGYQDENKVLVMNQRQVTVHYFWTWLTLDFISCLPWSIFELGRDTPTGLQLIAMMRIVTLRHFMGSLQSLNAALLTWIRIGLILLGYFCLANMLSCIWWYLIRSTNDGQYPLMTAYPDVEVLIYEKGRFEQYSICFYFIMATITTLGYGDCIPSSLRQRWFVSIVLLMTGFLDAFIFGYVVSLVSTFYSLYIVNLQRTKSIRQYVDNNVMPKEMEKRIWHYTHHKHHLRSRFDTQYVFQGYPRHLVKDVMIYSHYEKLTLLFGDEVEVDVLRQLAFKLQWTYCVAGELWVDYGRVGNHAFYLQRGTFVINHPGCCLRTLVGPVGAWYGANMLTGPMRRHKVVIEAIEDCDLYVLTRVDFERVMKDYPAWRQPLVEHLKSVHLPLHTIGNLRRSFVDDPLMPQQRESVSYGEADDEGDEEEEGDQWSTTRANTAANAGIYDDSPLSNRSTHSNPDVTNARSPDNQPTSSSPVSSSQSPGAYSPQTNEDGMVQRRPMRSSEQRRREHRRHNDTNQSQLDILTGPD